MVFVFKYDTPKFLKMKKNYVKLDEFMNKIYNSNARDRVQAIAVDEGTNNE